MAISMDDVQNIALELSLGVPKDELTVKIDTPELEKVYKAVKSDVDEAKANGWILDFGGEAFEAPDFVVVE